MKKSFKKYILPGMAALICVVLEVFLVYRTQKTAAHLDFSNSSAIFFDNISSSLDSRSELLDSIGEYNWQVGDYLVYNISYLYDGIDFRTLPSMELEQLQEEAEYLISGLGLQEFYITDPEGKIWLSSGGGLTGSGITEKGILTGEQWENCRIQAEYNSGSEEVSDLPEEARVIKTEKGDQTVYFYAYYLFSAEDSRDYLFIGAVEIDVDTGIGEHLADLDVYFRTIRDYDEIGAAAVDAETGVFTSVSEELEELKGKTASEAGLADLEALADGKEHTVLLGGTERTVMAQKYSSARLGSYYILTVTVEENEAISGFLRWFGLILAALTALYYTALLSGKGSGRKEMAKHAVVLGLGLMIAVTVISDYLRSMADISNGMEQAEVNAEIMTGALAENEELSSSVEKFYRERRIAICDSLRMYAEKYGDQILEKKQAEEYCSYTVSDSSGQRSAVMDPQGNPLVSARNNRVLKIMAGDAQADEIWILNGDGRTIATSGERWYYDLQSGSLGIEEELTAVLERKMNGFHRILREEDGQREYTAVPLRLYVSSDSGETVYHSGTEYLKQQKTGESGIHVEYGLMLVSAGVPSGIYMNSDSLNYELMTGITAAQATELALVDTGEDHAVLLMTEGLTEQEIAGIGFRDSDYENDNYRFASVSGKEVLAAMNPLSGQKDTVLLTVFKTEDLYYMKELIILSVLLLTLLLVTVLSLCFIFTERAETAPDFSDSPERQSSVPREQRGQVSIMALKKLNPGERIEAVARFIVGFLALVLLIRLGSAMTSDRYGQAFRYVVSERWERGFHIFSVSDILYIFLLTVGFVSFVRHMVTFLVPMLSSRTETMLRLVLSLIQYGTIVLLIFYSLYVFGVQMGTVLTSASIMTIVIGLGANSLIGDMLAGLFIIAEREYQVNDIVTIDNFTGIVKEISLRTTKVQDFNGNTKTFNNSKIFGVLNLTDNYTTFFLTLNISVEVPVDEIEKLVNEDLCELMKKDPDLVEGPWFSGIPEVKKGTYTISVGARCLQQRSWRLRKDLFRNLMQLLKQRGIRVE